MESIIIFVLICACIISFVAVRLYLITHKKCNKKGYIIVPCTSKTDNLEKIVKSYFWEEVFENENISREILIVSLEKSENDYLAKKLSSEIPVVSFVDITALEDYIMRKEFYCGRLKTNKGRYNE